MTTNLGLYVACWRNRAIMSMFFLFAHPPLIPVGRPYFTKLEFVNTIKEVLAKYPIDAYFLRPYP